jgi:type I restriction enzyme M protein
LRLLAGLIEGENWLGLGINVKGAIYDGLLKPNAQELKSGAGQYFTPRADRGDGRSRRSRTARDGA